MIEECIRHPEVKSLGPDGTTCMAETRGLLQRAHITAGRIRFIDKETSSMWAQGDDLSVVTDNDETGFRVIEYGKSRKIVLPDSLKREIKEAKLRELRRRGIGQHTIEKALHAHVRVKYLQENCGRSRRIQTRKTEIGQILNIALAWPTRSKPNNAPSLATVRSKAELADTELAVTHSVRGVHFSNIREVGPETHLQINDLDAGPACLTHAIAVTLLGCSDNASVT
jgi:hypothetical protein